MHTLTLIIIDTLP